ncbi:MAG: ABC transporter substrate-binding protein [Phycisphaerales bacterium]
MNRIHAIVFGLCIGVLVLLVVWLRSPNTAGTGTTPGTGSRSLGVEVVPEPPPNVDPEAIGTPLPASLLGDLRLVSVSPAVSRMLVDIGLEPAIVGRSRYCDFLDAELPVVGDLLALDVERLISLQPTHVFRQPAASTDPRPLARLASERGWAPPIEVRFDGVDDVRRTLGVLARRIGGPDDRRAAIAARARVLDARLAALVEPAAGNAVAGAGAGAGANANANPNANASGATAGVAAAPLEVLALYAVQPPGVFGRGTFIDQMLLGAGAVNAAAADGWLAWSVEDLVTRNPPVIILVTDQPAFAERVRTQAMGAWSGLGLDAVANGQVHVVAHPDALRPSTGLAEVGVALRAAVDAARAGRSGG